MTLLLFIESSLSFLLPLLQFDTERQTGIVKMFSLNNIRYKQMNEVLSVTDRPLSPLLSNFSCQVPM